MVLNVVSNISACLLLMPPGKCSILRAAVTSTLAMVVLRILCQLDQDIENGWKVRVANISRVMANLEGTHGRCASYWWNSPLRAVLADATVGIDEGELRLRCSLVRTIFLDNFRLILDYIASAVNLLHDG
jgi:hypothetical protein